MNAAELEQGTQEWINARLGFVTASRIGDVLSKPRKGQPESTGRRNYRAELIAEILSGKQGENYISWDMQRGTELEPFARVEYEMQTNTIVDKVGFIVHPKIPRCGASPDGAIGADGLVQFKAPKTAIHLDYIMAGMVPAEYRPQMLLEMAVTGRKWNDFCSYDPRLTGYELFIVRLQRNDAEIAEMELEIAKFNAEVDKMIAALPPAGKTALEHQLEKSLNITDEDVPF